MRCLNLIKVTIDVLNAQIRRIANNDSGERQGSGENNEQPRRNSLSTHCLHGAEADVSHVIRHQSDEFEFLKSVTCTYQSFFFKFCELHLSDDM